MPTSFHIRARHSSKGLAKSQPTATAERNRLPVNNLANVISFCLVGYNPMSIGTFTFVRHNSIGIMGLEQSPRTKCFALFSDHSIDTVAVKHPPRCRICLRRQRFSITKYINGHLDILSAPSPLKSTSHNLAVHLRFLKNATGLYKRCLIMV